MDDRITINGIAYVKEQQPPDCVKFYFMHDGFRFSRLKGNSLQEIAIEASYIACKPEGAWGALCPVILMRGKEEIRRVGPMVHARGVGESMHGWNEEVSRWIEVVSADQDVMRLLAEKDQPPPPSWLNRVNLEFI